MIPSPTLTGCYVGEITPDVDGDGAADIVERCEDSWSVSTTWFWGTDVFAAGGSPDEDATFLSTEWTGVDRSWLWDIGDLDGDGTTELISTGYGSGSYGYSYVHGW